VKIPLLDIAHMLIFCFLSLQSLESFHHIGSQALSWNRLDSCLERGGQEVRDA
jgi:hypothetical protein